MFRLFKFFLSLNFLLKVLPYIFILALFTWLIYEAGMRFIVKRKGWFDLEDKARQKGVMLLCAFSLGCGVFSVFYQDFPNAFDVIRSIFAWLSPFITIVLCVILIFYLRNNLSENGCVLAVTVLLMIVFCISLLLCFMYNLLCPHHYLEKNEPKRDTIEVVDPAKTSETTPDTIGALPVNKPLEQKADTIQQ